MREVFCFMCEIERVFCMSIPDPIPTSYPLPIPSLVFPAQNIVARAIAVSWLALGILPVSVSPNLRRFERSLTYPRTHRLSLSLSLHPLELQPSTVGDVRHHTVWTDIQSSFNSATKWMNKSSCTFSGSSRRYGSHAAVFVTATLVYCVYCVYCGVTGR